MARRALITGITGQDGSYLCDLLLEKGYEVHGITRYVTSLETGNLAHLVNDPEIYRERLFVHGMEVFDNLRLERIVMRIEPEEIYHLAGQSSPRLSFDFPEQTLQSNATYTLQMLELNRLMEGPAKFFFASSCEVFGKTDAAMQDETTPVQLVTPYGAAKAYAQNLVTIYRENYGLPCGSGIMFNHESPRRNPNFVSKKIAQGVAAIKRGERERLVLGSLEAKRDWGWAPDYVEGMWRMLQEEEIEDYVFATGISHSVEELVDACFRSVDLDWRDHVDCDPSLNRKAEMHPQCGNFVHASGKLGWAPTVTFEEMARLLVEAEM